MLVLVSILLEVFGFELSLLGTDHSNRPINTYNGQGVTKPGLSESDRRAHAIIYMTDTRPSSLPEEGFLTKKPIAVEKASADQEARPNEPTQFQEILYD